MGERWRMEAGRERGVQGVAGSAALGVASVDQQTEVCGFMGMSGKLSTGAMREFRQNHAGQLNPALRFSIELTGFEGVAHGIGRRLASIDAEFITTFRVRQTQRGRRK